MSKVKYTCTFRCRNCQQTFTAVGESASEDEFLIDRESRIQSDEKMTHRCFGNISGVSELIRISRTGVMDEPEEE